MALSTQKQRKNDFVEPLPKQKLFFLYLFLKANDDSPAELGSDGGGDGAAFSWTQLSHSLDSQELLLVVIW